MKKIITEKEKDILRRLYDDDYGASTSKMIEKYGACFSGWPSYSSYGEKWYQEMYRKAVKAYGKKIFDADKNTIFFRG